MPARMALPLAAVDQNRWSFERQGAWLKPNCYGDRVDLTRVDRARLYLLRSAPETVHWCHTPLRAVEEVQPLTHPYLPKGPLLDEFGQSTLRDWHGKTRGETELVARLTHQHDQSQQWPNDYSRWGGWKGLHFEANGWFRTHHDGKRWWLVDPDGFAFWSTGLDCVGVDTDAWTSGLEDAHTWLPSPNGAYAQAFIHPHDRPMFNYLSANFIRAFGQEHWHDHWGDITILMLKGLGLNTIANWSDTLLAAQRQVPYVRPLGQRIQELPCVFHDFPDVFHPDFAKVAEAYAEPLQRHS